MNVYYQRPSYNRHRQNDSCRFESATLRSRQQLGLLQIPRLGDSMTSRENRARHPRGKRGLEVLPTDVEFNHWGAASFLATASGHGLPVPPWPTMNKGEPLRPSKDRGI